MHLTYSNWKQKVVFTIYQEPRRMFFFNTCAKELCNKRNSKIVCTH